jgi:membrane protein YdbS with pleckstrin-like domain
MPYYTKVLQPDEKVLVVGRLHWSIYGPALVVLAAALALLMLSYRVSDPVWQHYTLLAAGGCACSGSCCCSASRSAGMRQRSW